MAKNTFIICLELNSITIAAIFYLGLLHRSFHINNDICKENRIYIRGEFRESLGMNFFNPFQPEREFKVYKLCKFSQIICSKVH